MHSYIREIETFTCRTVPRLEDPLIAVTSDNENKLLELIRPLIKTTCQQTWHDERDYVESRLWLPYIKDLVVKDLDKLAESNRKQIEVLSIKINKHNELPWWKRLKRIR